MKKSWRCGYSGCARYSSACTPRCACCSKNCKCCDKKIDPEQLRHALEQNMPNTNMWRFKQPFKDGDAVPLVKTFDGGPTEWLGVTVSDGSGARVWLEKPTSGERSLANNDANLLRIQLPPGVRESSVLPVVASRTTGQSCTVSLRAIAPFEYRTYDGSDNNRAHPHWGVANEPLFRIAPANYADDKSEMISFANPRSVSNALSRYTGGGGNPPASTANLSDLVWTWGQFIDHDLDLTPSDKSFPAPIVAPSDDPTLPNGTIGFSRSQHTVDDNGVWQQTNILTSFLDAGNVYGHSETRALGLRTLDGSGKLKTSHNGALPPLNVGLVFENESGSGQHSSAEQQFLCGDVRANENPALCAMHSLFVLEHNRLCDELLEANPCWQNDDERLYQEARRTVTALIQHITVDHFLTTLFGESNALPAYAGYNQQVRPDVASEFSAALYRIGHTMVSNEIAVRTGSDEQVFPLADVFFNPRFLETHGVSAVLEGAAHRRMQEIDRFVVEALRNMLFGRPNEPSGALHDLVSINLQRGADHGLRKYNDTREAYGLARKSTFADVSSDAQTQAALANAYASVDEIDLWIGALCEDKVAGAQVGELSMAGIREQFVRLRDGDRFWYENALSADAVAQIKNTTLADVIRRNTRAQVQNDVFHV